MRTSIDMSHTSQAGSGFGHLKIAIRELKNFEFEHGLQTTDKEKA